MFVLRQRQDYGSVAINNAPMTIASLDHSRRSDIESAAGYISEILSQIRNLTDIIDHEVKLTNRNFKNVGRKNAYSDITFGIINLTSQVFILFLKCCFINNSNKYTM